MEHSNDLFDVFDPTDSSDQIDPQLISLLNAMRADATPEELLAEASIVNSMRAAMQPAPLNDVPIRSSSMRQRFSTSKTATKMAIISGVVLFSATAAAAGGVLPDAAQSALSRAASHIGVHLANPNDESGVSDETLDTSGPSDDTATDDTATDDTAVGPDANGPARAGLCQAWTAHQLHPTSSDDSQAMKNLNAAATTAGETVQEFCAPTTPNTTHSQEGSNGNSGSHGSSSTSSTTPGVTLPDSANSGATLPDNANNNGNGNGNNNGNGNSDSKSGNGSSSHSDGAGNSHGG